jgi:nucleoid-associated protein YgaU
MARETKVGLIVGLGVILFVSVFVSDYISAPVPNEAIGDSPSPNFVEQTTNQPEFVLQREQDTQPASGPIDPRDLAAAGLDRIDPRRPLPAPVDPPSVTIGTPPFREGVTLTEPIDDSTPIAIDTTGTNASPIGYASIDDSHLARGHQLAPERDGPGVDPLEHLQHVDIPEPQLFNAQPVNVTHVVAPGETLTAIARKHYDGDGNMWRSIRDANPGKVGANGEIVQGVTLKIPKRSTESADPTGDLAQRSAAGGEQPQRRRVRMITVKEGETLSELASKHLGSAGMWQLIMDVNADVLEKPTQLRAGMKLRIPAEPVVRIIEEANAALADSEDTRESAADTRSENQPSATATYTVKEGDSLYRIAQNLLGDGDRYDEIFKANQDKLSSAGDIRVGMKLTLPER